MSRARRIVAWRDVAKPHNDIVEGRFDPSVFAVNIYAVYRNKAPSDYQEPERFFAKTYMTRGLKELISSVLRRLDGQPNAEAVTDLVTSFGGGKTHALLCLYHLAKEGKTSASWKGVAEQLKEAELKTIPKSKVVVLSGEDIDVAQGVKGEKEEPDRHTMWGELAWQLGGEKGYALVKKNDESRSSPAAETLTKVLALNPSNLILIDEALRYVSRGRAIVVHETSLGAQALNFFEALTVAVAQSPKTAMVVTLPASLLEMAKEDEQDFKRLKHLFQRIERTRRLAEGDEIYEIVRRRLFEDLGDPEEHANTANAYFDYYREHRDSFAETVTTPVYLEKLKRAYPFHPEFLDVLNEEWSSIPQFQRTRGMLRMLALLIGELYKTDSNPLIQISSAKFSVRDFRSEVLEQLDARQFDAVIESDISGTGARAARIDEQGNLTYQREHIAEGVATAIFFYSFGGTAGEPAASLPKIRLGVLRPGLEPAFIADAIQLLRKPISGLFYLNVEGERYRFTVTPNLNMILAEREASVNNDDVEKLVLDSIQKQVGSRFKIAPYPDEPRDVADQAQLTLVVLSPDDTIGKNTKASTEEKILSIIKGGATYRTNRNCLIFVAPDENNLMRQAARTVIALKDIERLYAKTNRLSQTQKSQLEDMTDDAERALAQSIWQAYRFVITPAPEDKLEPSDMGRQIQRADRKISDSIWDSLVDKERLAPKIGPSRLLSRDLPVWKDSEASISTRALRDAFLSYTYLPMIPSIDVLRDTIIQGIQNGDFAYARGAKEKLHPPLIGRMVERDAVEFADDAFLLRPEEAYRLLGTAPTLAGVTAPTAPTSTVEMGAAQAQPSTRLERYNAVNISADLDWKKWSEFHEAVIQPLVNAGADLKVKVEVTGSSEEGIPTNTVDFAIKEGLTQYGIPAKVEPKKRES
jgi:hypothetical protein